ncbi:phosphatidate cytidylyltransferase [Pedobacter sp. HMF7647]|uniref:Phosphatidate cytidylyltransferase n=1 Tax=Hufsiella arboris TaxID=2695275 RepID=A0A7K1Y6X0_9SPHI|nr:phosphatidate cytidylyltransferase [Hufsiella arboris]MXV49798.1 phosphatidate cytidylyltransferase [Hufsiella arboris]
MKTRAITGFFFVVVMLASELLGVYAFAFFFLVLSVLNLNEFYSLVKNERISPQRINGLLLGGALFVTVVFWHVFDFPAHYFLAAVPLLTLIYIAELYRKKDNPFINIAFTFTGIVFCVIPFCFFALLAFLDGSFEYHLPLGFLLLLWSSDTGAYLFGVKLGKNKLFERHSPKKTWEGFFGGLLTSLVVAFILSLYFKELAFVHWAVVSVIIVVFGTIGDLTESMLKRSMNIKDSGSILPGHGGLLDRFDGLFLSAPVVFTYLYFITMV